MSGYRQNSRRRCPASLVLVIAALGMAPAAGASAQELQIAELGECVLESGEVIRDCRIGYRTAGTLKADGSNAVLFTTWTNGTSDQLIQYYVGAEGFVDPAVHFVIAVDAFGNGVSSSPSNSREHPGATFPAFTIRDMVRAQYRLLTEVLGIERLHAVVGISMGGFQAFEWAVTYPDFAARVVPVVGTPQASSHDLLTYALLEGILDGCEPDDCERAREVGHLALRVFYRTPQHRIRTLSPDEVPAYIGAIPGSAARMPVAIDFRSQVRALASMDVAGRFDGSLEMAARAVRAAMLIVVAASDLLVTPESSRDFARLMGARLHELDGDCGHQAFVCEEKEVGKLVRAFLR